MTGTIPKPTPSDTPTLETASGDPARIQEFKLNHPKNYLAVPLAVVADGETDALIRDHAVNLPHRARRGAEETGLITSTGDVTALGETVIVTGTRLHGSPQEALHAFEQLHGSPKRFTDVHPGWQAVCKRLAFQYEPTKHLVDFLRQQGELSLHELTWLLWKREPELAKTVFLHPETIESHTVGPNSPPTSDIVMSADSYRSESTFQFKNFLYHCGIVDERGDHTSRLTPEQDTWNLSQ